MSRLLRNLLLLALAAVIPAAFSSCIRATPRKPDDDFGFLRSFTLTDRTGKVVSRSHLDGYVWVASFIFTRCSGPCPAVTASMAKLQKEFADKEDFMLVTFSVDPEHDTPEVLKRYADSFRADPKCWLFLTGNRDEI